MALAAHAAVKLDVHAMAMRRGEGRDGGGPGETDDVREDRCTRNLPKRRSPWSPASYSGDPGELCCLPQPSFVQISACSGRFGRVGLAPS